MEVFGPMINTSVLFQYLAVAVLLVIRFVISTMHSVSFPNWYVSVGREYHQHNSES